jgi:hypothetical protein
VISDADLARMSTEERSDLASRLMVLTEADPQAWMLRRWVTLVVASACVVLVPWTVALAATLPPHYTASHWRLTWVGLDVALIVFLGRTAWLTYRGHRRSATIAAIVTATLLYVDAWFDVTTATGRADRVASLVTAVLGELPLAIFIGFVAARTVRAAGVRDRPPRVEATPQG